MNLSQKWSAFVSKMNSQGIPIPMVRYNGEGNPALTLVVVSSVMVVASLVGKAAGLAGGIDTGNALQFFYASCTLFFGHTWVHKNGNNSDTIDGGDGNK